MRANFITSVDGGATVEGLSGAMGGPGDRIIFTCCGNSRTSSWSARAPCGRGLLGRAVGRAQRQQRQARGQSEVPQLAIVTKIGSPGPGHGGVHPHRGAAAGAHLHRGRRETRRALERLLPR